MKYLKFVFRTVCKAYMVFLPGAQGDLSESVEMTNGVVTLNSLDQYDANGNLLPFDTTLFAYPRAPIFAGDK